MWGFNCRNSLDRFLESLSAAVFDVPGIWEAVILISKYAEKNQRHRKRCITVGSLEEPLLTESTTLLLSHLNSTLVLDSNGPQTAQLKTIGANSFALYLFRTIH